MPTGYKLRTMRQRAIMLSYRRTKYRATPPPATRASTMPTISRSAAVADVAPMRRLARRRFAEGVVDDCRPGGRGSPGCTLPAGAVGIGAQRTTQLSDEKFSARRHALPSRLAPFDAHRVPVALASRAKRESTQPGVQFDPDKAVVLPDCRATAYRCSVSSIEAIASRFGVSRVDVDCSSAVPRRFVHGDPRQTAAARRVNRTFTDTTGDDVDVPPAVSDDPVRAGATTGAAWRRKRSRARMVSQDRIALGLASRSKRSIILSGRRVAVEPLSTRRGRFNSTSLSVSNDSPTVRRMTVDTHCQKIVPRRWLAPSAAVRCCRPRRSVVLKSPLCIGAEGSARNVSSSDDAEHAVGRARQRRRQDYDYGAAPANEPAAHHDPPPPIRHNMHVTRRLLTKDADRQQVEQTMRFAAARARRRDDIKHASPSDRPHDSFSTRGADAVEARYVE